MARVSSCIYLEDEPDEGIDKENSPDDDKYGQWNPLCGVCVCACVKFTLYNLQKRLF